MEEQPPQTNNVPGQQIPQTVPKTPKKKKRTGLIVFIVVLVVVLMIGGYFLTTYLLNKKVKDIIDEGIEQVDLSIACREVEIQAIVLEDTSGGAGTQYDLSLKRTGTGGDIGGVKVVLFNNNVDSEVLDFGYALVPLTTKTQSLTLATPVTNANRVDMTVYFIIDGEQMVCPTTVTKEFFNF